ncbi:MAG: hypothetical protein ACFB6R_04190 [Alphaproteobacteria bacterium]
MMIRTSTLALLTAAIAVSVPQHDAAAMSPKDIADNGWIAVTGEVVQSTDEAFMIDYGDGVITVEMDDWDSYDEANRIMAGEAVTVYGTIDKNVYELRTIEASSVYAHARHTYFYASAADEEGAFEAFQAYPDPYTVSDGTYVSVMGVVGKISGREFDLKTGGSAITVDTNELSYNPLDDVGFQQIDKGDVVQVSGFIDNGFFDGREIRPLRITTLSESRQ